MTPIQELHHQIMKQKAPSNPKGEVTDSNKVSKQHKTDALPETGDKSENTNATLFGAMMALLGSLLLFRNASKITIRKSVRIFCQAEYICIRFFC